MQLDRTSFRRDTKKTRTRFTTLTFLLTGQCTDPLRVLAMSGGVTR